MSETAELKKRLEALEGKPQNLKARPSFVAIALGIGAIAVLGGLLLLFSGSSEPESLETASPDEFQAAGPGFGALEPAPAPIDTSQPPEPEPASETEELRAQMDAMRTIGMNPAEILAVELMVHHDRDTLEWSDEPLTPVELKDHDGNVLEGVQVTSDPPPWWRVRGSSVCTGRSGRRSRRK